MASTNKTNTLKKRVEELAAVKGYRRGANKCKMDAAPIRNTGVQDTSKDCQQERCNEVNVIGKKLVERNGMLAKRTMIVCLNKNAVNMPDLEHRGDKQNRRCGNEP